MTSVNPHAVAELWASFEAKVLHPQSPPEQRREMKMAFYGGAQGLLLMIMAIMDPGEEITEHDEVQMASISAELDAFGEEIIASLPVADRA